MNQSIQLKIKKLPQALGELAHSNQFLKMSAFFSYGLCFLMIGVIYVMAVRPPVVLALAPDASVYQSAVSPKPENEVRQAAERYLELRYRWEPKTIVKQLEAAQSFILPGMRKSFEASTANVVRFSVEKGVAQRVYAGKALVNLERKAVSMSGDRVTSIQGLRAAGELKLELSFDFGPRTEKNPWGVYFTKETEQ